MSTKRPTLRRHLVLDDTQTQDAMKVLERYCKAKYRNSMLISQNDLDRMPSELLSPTPGRQSTFAFNREPTLDRQSTMFSIHSPHSPSSPDAPNEMTIDFRGHKVAEQLRFNEKSESLLLYIFRVIKFFLCYLGLKHFFFILFLILFILFGGFVFMSIEHPMHMSLKKLQAERNVQRYNNFSDVALLDIYKSGCFEKVTNDSELDVQMSSKNSLCRETIKKLFIKYEKKYEEDRVNMNQYDWTYSNSVFYSTTLIATIGYGNITCKSLLGRIFTLFYGIMGIPLMLTIMNIVGKSLLEQLLSLWIVCKKRCKNMFRHKKYTVKEPETVELANVDDDGEEIDSQDVFETFPLWLALLIAIIFIIGCSVFFSYSEGWDFFTSFYFTIISFTTVGFGDIVPTNLGHAVILLFFYFPGFCISSLFIALVQMGMEKNYMLALQLIDQHGEILEHTQDELERNVKSVEPRPDTLSNVKWRGGDISRDSSPGRRMSSMHRYSSMMISSPGDTPVATPPVLTTFLNNAMSIRRKSLVTRSESIISRSPSSIKRPYTNSPSESDLLTPTDMKPKNLWSSLSTESQKPMGSYTSLAAPRGTTAAPLSVITECSDEDSLQYRRSRGKSENLRLKLRTDESDNSSCESEFSHRQKKRLLRGQATETPLEEEQSLLPSSQKDQ